MIDNSFYKKVRTCVSKIALNDILVFSKTSVFNILESVALGDEGQAAESDECLSIRMASIYKEFFDMASRLPDDTLMKSTDFQYQ